MSQIDTSDQQDDLFNGEVDATTEQIMSQYQALDDLSEHPNQKWPDRLAELHDILESYLKTSVNIADDKAHKIADGIVTVIAKNFGGRPFYMPKGKSLVRELRNIEIYSKFNGRNHSQLAEEYDLSVAQIYDIVAQQYQLRRKKSQPELPGLDNDR